MDTGSEKSKSLESRVIKYDLEALKSEAESEFDTTATSKELVDQEFIGQIFKLEGGSDERN